MLLFNDLIKKMNMKNTIKNFAVSLVSLALILSFNACNFLDVDDFFNEQLKYDSIFTNKTNIERYLWATAASFGHEGGIFFGGNFTPGITATDEAFSLGGSYRGYDLVNGTMTAASNGYIPFYKDMYQVIRKANTILANMHQAQMSNIERNDIRAFTYFLRGYAYYQLLMAFGPVVILGDDVLENNEEVQYYAKYRSTYDECVDYICNEFQTASRLLPIDIPLHYYGRPNRGAALALIARLRLQHASPLFNGGGDPSYYSGNVARSSYGEFVRKDGVHYIKQTYEERRWAVAAMAAKRIIDMDKYNLHLVETMPDTPEFPDNVSKFPFPYGVGGIDPYHSYKDMFDGETLPTKNPEIIWGKQATSNGPVFDIISRCIPVTNFRGINNLAVTQKIVDAYYLDDGRTIEQAKLDDDGYYKESGYLGDNYVNEPLFRRFSGYTLGGTQNGTTGKIHNMYVNREMRFYACVGFDGYFYQGNTINAAAQKNWFISHQKSGNGGKGAASSGDADTYPITGYVLRKYIHPDDAMTDGTIAGGRISPKPFAIIRYAEILLSYVEAINWLTQSYTLKPDELFDDEMTITRDVEEIKYYFNMVRFRAGLPGITDEEAEDPHKVQALIERERMIEFMCENRRYFDVRRWGIYQDTERELIMGMNIDQDGDNYYVRTPLNHRRARERVGSDNLKNILLPLPINEIRRVPELDQNPGWER